MRSALVGFSGFVGSNLCAQYSFGKQFNSRNIETISGEKFDHLVFAGAQAKKWWANQNPEDDRRGIQRALDALSSVTASRVTLVSTIDVLPPREGADELVNCGHFDNHPYGTNQLALEFEFQRMFPDCLTVRLPGLFGPGLKKNVIYDLLVDNLVEKINPNSRFQYYDLNRLWSDLTLAHSAALKIVHLVTEPIQTAEILERFFPDKAVATDPSPSAAYDFRTRHAAVFGGADGYIENRDAVLERLAHFIAKWRAGEARTPLSKAAVPGREVPS